MSLGADSLSSLPSVAPGGILSQARSDLNPLPPLSITDHRAFFLPSQGYSYGLVAGLAPPVATTGPTRREGAKLCGYPKIISNFHPTIPATLSQ